MSLNGLDAAPVQEAYNTAVAEASGWFLLKYASRDAVELLAHGKNGVAEARNAIKEYTEASPLYGLIVYRRRRILIKYLPEDTSRLLKARTTVHLQDVLERFAPYENLLEITTSDALNDTSLASSFQLHTASPSPSTIRLDEIREDGEDSGPAALGLASSARSSGNMSAAQKYKAERRIDQLKRKTERSTSPLRVSDASPALPPEPSAPQPPPKPSMAQYLVHEEQGQTSVTRLESPMSTRSMTEDGVSTASTKSEDSTLKGVNVSDSASQTTVDAGDVPSMTHSPSSPEDSKQRHSRAITPLDRELPDPPSTSASNMSEMNGKHSLDDPYDLRKYDEWFKPKVKLGPRPVNPAESKNRPTTARVSALPANFKPAAKKQEQARPPSFVSKSPAPVMPVAAPSPAAPLFNYAPPPIPKDPEYEARPVSRGSVTTAKSAVSNKSTMMTPDKLRLMKAIEHRKRQLRKSRDQQLTKPPIPDDVPDVPEVPQEVEKESANSSSLEPSPAKGDGSQTLANKADSGIEIHYDKPEQRQEEKSDQPTFSPRSTSLGQGKPLAPNPDVAKESILQAQNDAISQKADRSNKDVSEDAPLPAPTAVATESATEATSMPDTVQPPVRVPTIVMADGSRPMTSEGPSQRVKNETMTDAEESPVSEDDSTSDTLEPPLSPRRQNSDLAKRRRGFVEPLTIEVHSGNPDDFASDDEEFLDELHNATVQEAKPMMVARSPITSTFSGRRPSADTLASVRSVNITRNGSVDKLSSTPPDRVSPEPVKSQSSSAITSPVDKNDSISSRNVSSGISKRIQLLTDMTNREIGPAISLHSRPLTPEYSPNPFVQQGRKSAAPRPRPTSFRRHSGQRSGQVSAGPTPTNENAPTWTVQHDPATNRNSVLVSSRIVRQSVIEEPNDDGQVSPTESETTLHGKRESAADQLPPLQTTISQSNASPPALSPATSHASAETRTIFSVTSRFARHRHNSSSTADDFPPQSRAGTSSTASTEDSAASKEGGRTTRFLKRFSNFGGPRRKNGSHANSNAASISSLATITATEESAAPSQVSQRMSMAADTPPAVVVGDLNVQFPDSLLWKRRIVTIDETGHLQFAIAHAMEIHKGVAQKRYPLGEFCAPYAPDLDSQELAHSVVLELQDGTALQAACEDAMTQRQVLHLLRTYWKAWNSVAT